MSSRERHGGGSGFRLEREGARERDETEGEAQMWQVTYSGGGGEEVKQTKLETDKGVSSAQ